jgi:uncharacterized protein YuzE
MSRDEAKHHIHYESQVCPECSYLLDHMEDRLPCPPAPGHVTVCAYCASPIIFDEHVKMQPMLVAMFEKAGADARALLCGYVIGVITRLANEGNTRVSIRTDKRANAMYFAVRKVGAGSVGRTVRVDGDVSADFDRDGKMVGVELLDATRYERMLRL